MVQKNSPSNVDCFCVCHDRKASNAFCRHCNGNNVLSKFWIKKRKK